MNPLRTLWKVTRRAMLASAARRYNRDHIIHAGYGMGASAMVSCIAMTDKRKDGTWDTEEHGWKHPVGKQAALINGFALLQRTNEHEDGSMSCEYKGLTVCLCLFTGNIFYFSPAYKRCWHHIVYEED